MESCIYRGKVKHIRYRPARNAFTYSLFMLCLDLTELDEVFRGRWLWSVGRPNLAWLKRKDHFGDPKFTIADAVRNLVEEKTGRRPEGPIRMLAHLRYFGHASIRLPSIIVMTVLAANWRRSLSRSTIPLGVRFSAMSWTRR